MITVIPGTNRPESNTRKVAGLVLEALAKNDGPEAHRRILCATIENP